MSADLTFYAELAQPNEVWQGNPVDGAGLVDACAALAGFSLSPSARFGKWLADLELGLWFL